MQITLPRRELKEAVTGFGKIVNGRVTLPVLGCVRFEADAQGVSGQVTDLDQIARYRFGDAEVEGTGAFLVSLADLKELAKGSQHETVEFRADQDWNITVTNHVHGHAVTRPVATMDPDEWPAIGMDVKTGPAEGFIETYRRLTPFSSTDDTRHVINSVFVEIGTGPNPVTMVATDGRRLSCWNSMKLPIKKSVIVPVTKFLAWNQLPADAGVGVRDDAGQVWLGVTSRARSPTR